MGSRRRAREAALQVLYQVDMLKEPPEEALDLYFAHFASPESSRPFAEFVVQGVHNHLGEIDELMASASEHWRLDRMSPVDRNILRLAIFEMLFCDDIPPKVSINEAIDLGKKFGSEDSGPFINGVLDEIFLRLSKEGRLTDKNASR